MAKTDTVLAQTPIRAGEYLTIWMVSAHRDEQKFYNADRLEHNGFP